MKIIDIESGAIIGEISTNLSMTIEKALENLDYEYVNMDQPDLCGYYMDGDTTNNPVFPEDCDIVTDSVPVYFLPKYGVNPDRIYGGGPVVCLPASEVLRLSAEWDTNLMAQMRKASDDEIASYGIYED